MLERVAPEGTARRVARLLMQLMRSEALHPGDRLPAEQHLARSLGVSRASVREALAVLDEAGLIERRKGSGTYIRRLRSPEVLEALVGAARTDAAFFAELLVVREALEGKAAELAAIRATREELAAIDEAAERIARPEAETDGGLAADLEFHLTVAAASGNAALFRMVREVGSQLAHVRRRTLQLPGRRQEAAREHRTIAEAIRAGDPARAHQAVADHLRQVQVLVHQLAPERTAAGIATTAPTDDPPGNSAGGVTRDG